MKTAVKYYFWSFLERILPIFFQLVTTILLARALMPSDFGVISVLFIFNALSLVIIDSGFSQALIRSPEVSDIEYNSIFIFNATISILIYLGLALSAPYIANFFKNEDLNSVALVYFLNIPISSFGIVSMAVLYRKLNFKEIALCSIVSAIISSAIALTMSYYYKSYWALVYQTLSCSLIKAILLLTFGKWRFKLEFSLQSIQKHIPFSINLLGTGISAAIFDNLYSIVLGYKFSVIDLGNYTQAKRIQHLLPSTITSIAMNVFFPRFSQIQKDKAKLKVAFIKSQANLLNIICIVMGCLFVSVDDLFPILLTEKWNDSIFFFKALCLVGILFPVHISNVNILKVTGNGSLCFKLEIFNKIIMVFFLSISIKWGIKGVIYGQLLYYLVTVFCIDIVHSAKEIGVGFRDQLTSILPVFSSLILSVMGVLIVGYKNNIYPLLTIVVSICFLILFFIVLSSLFGNIRIPWSRIYTHLTVLFKTKMKSYRLYFSIFKRLYK